MEQIRSELLQEKAAKQDLECDKISLERQVRTAGSMSSCLPLPRVGLLVFSYGNVAEALPTPGSACGALR